MFGDNDNPKVPNNNVLDNLHHFTVSKFDFGFSSHNSELNSKLIIINQQLKDKLGIYEVKYKEIIEEYTKLQSICKDLESFYLETFNKIFKK